MSNSHKLMCGYEIFISEPKIQSELNSWGSRHIENVISISKISHSRNLVKREKNRLLHKLGIPKFFSPILKSNSCIKFYLM